MEALQYLNKNPRENVTLISILNEGAKVLYASKHGCVLESHIAYFISFDDFKEARRVLPKLNLKDQLSYTPQREITKILGWDFKPFYQFQYLKKNKIDIDDQNIRQLTIADFDYVREHYNVVPAETMKKYILEGEMIGIEEDGKLVGFIGVHDEKSMGQLYIEEKCRNKGYAFKLEANLINKLKQEGRVIFCHVRIDNIPSIKLQKKLGEVKDKRYSYWYM